MPCEDQPQLLYKTFSFRVKDATSRKYLVRLGNAVNTLWNYCNEISQKSAQRGPKWATKQQLRDLTKGAGRELDLPSQVVQEVIDEFITQALAVVVRRGATGGGRDARHEADDMADTVG